MVCKNCNKEFTDGFLYCPYCGKRADGKKVCVKCGAEIDEEFVFCPVCGAKQNVETAEKPVQKETVVAVPEVEAVHVQDKSEDFFEVKADAPEVHETVRPARKVKKRSPGDRKKIFEKIRKSMDTGLVGKLVLVAVTMVFFICSFFSVFEIKMTDTIKQFSGEKVKFEDDITMRVDAVSLMDFAFFALTADSSDAQDYLDKEMQEETYLDKIAEVMVDDDYIRINMITQSVTLTKKGCNKISDIVSDADLLKITYASISYDETGIDYKDSVSSLITAGILALVNVIVCGAAFIVSLVLLFTKKKCGGVRLVALVLASSVAFGAYINSLLLNNEFMGNDGINVGGALGCIIAFAVTFFAYRLAVRIMSEKRENLKKLVVNATAVAAGIIVLSCAALPAVNTALTYIPADENANRVTFRYSFTQFETFDQYFMDVGEDNYLESEELKEIFDTEAQRFTQSAGDRAEGNIYFKSTIGINGFLNTRFFSESYGFVKAFDKIQPIFSLIALYAVAAMFSLGVAYLCGGKEIKAVKGIALILLLLAGAYGIFSTVLLNATLNTSELLPKVNISVGSSPIVQIVFAALGIIAFIVAKIFKDKYIGKKEPEPAPEQSVDADFDFEEQIN